MEGKRGQMVNGVTRIGIAERVGEIQEAREEERGWQKIKPRRNGRPWLGSRMHRVLDGKGRLEELRREFAE